MTCSSHRLLARFRRRDSFVTIWHEENREARELREKNVDILNKTYYESGFYPAIESRRYGTAAATKFRLDFFFHRPCRLGPILRSCPRYRLLVIIFPVSLYRVP